MSPRALVRFGLVLAIAMAVPALASVNQLIAGL